MRTHLSFAREEADAEADSMNTSSTVSKSFADLLDHHRCTQDVSQSLATCMETVLIFDFPNDECEQLKFEFMP